MAQDRKYWMTTIMAIYKEMVKKGEKKLPKHYTKGSFKCYVMQWGVAGVSAFPGKKHYEGVRFNVVSVTRGWVGVKFPGNCVTLECP